jgi:hypothetical protein
MTRGYPTNFELLQIEKLVGDKAIVTMNYEGMKLNMNEN